MAVKFGAGGLQSYDPLASLKKKKKKEETKKVETPAERKEAGTRYIQEREKALSQGYSLETANEIAESKSRPGRTVVEAQQAKEEFLKDLGKEEKPGNLEITGKGKKSVGVMEAIKKPFEKTQLLPEPFAELTGLPGEVQVPLEAKAAIASLITPFLVGGQILVGQKAVQAATASKTTAVTRPILSKMASYAISGYAALKGGEAVVGYFTGRKIDEQQQTLNTLGQMASTIVGDSTSGAGDWRKGLQELNYIKREILRLEGAIKAGSITSFTIKFNGKIYDINADIADQLATIDEGIRDIRTFALQGEMPELSEYELQALVRQYEEEGLIEPVNLETSRRPV